MNTSDTLYLAADLIEERGWRQGLFGWGEYEDVSGLCLEGGIAAALEMKPGRNGWLPLSELAACPAYRAVSAYLDVSKLWTWNDDAARTASEVVEVLRAAAVVEAARESQPAEQVTANV